MKTYYSMKGESKLRTLARVLILSFIILVFSIYNYGTPETPEPLQNEHSLNPPKLDNQYNISQNQMNDGTKRPEEGISVYIGKSKEEWIKQFGEPDRKDLSAYGFEWWIYNDKAGEYMQVGISDDRVVTLYALGEQLNLFPYAIGQTIEEIYRSTLLETEIVVASKSGTYRFELSEEDLYVRPLIQMGDIYAQLYLDKFTGTLSSVRFLDKRTLVTQRPYELEYRGDLPDTQEPTEEEWLMIEKGSAKQIFDITNIFRNKFDLEKLIWNEQIAQIAYEHSKDMFLNGYFAHESPIHGDLDARLQTEEMEYELATENIAADYADGPAAVEGWMNSDGHRKIILNKEVTELGVGVHKKFYTQNFIAGKVQ